MFKKIIILVLLAFGLSAMVTTIPKEGLSVSVNKATDNEGHPAVAVLELFTSQGCSSCPPADALLQKVREDNPNRVLALAYHVDYWNYIGWKDPFSNPAFTKKQSEYNRKFGYGGNYTPELVVNGKQHFVGSNRAKLFTAIDRIKSETAPNSIWISQIVIEDQNVTFQYNIAGPLEGKRSRVALVLDKKITRVNRGENRNRTLTNTNVVVAEKYLPITGRDGTSEIRIPALAKNEKLSLIVLLEHENLDILSAAQTSIQ